MPHNASMSHDVVAIIAIQLISIACSLKLLGPFVSQQIASFIISIL